MWAQKYIATYRVRTVCMYREEMKRKMFGGGREARRWTAGCIPFRTEYRQKKEVQGNNLKQGKNDFFGEKPNRTTVLKVKQFLWTVARLTMRALTRNSDPSITYRVALSEQTKKRPPCSFDHLPNLTLRPTVKQARSAMPRSLTWQSKPLEALKRTIWEKKEKKWHHY